MRTTFAPNDPERQAKHMVALQRDIGPWFNDYAEEIGKPAIDFDLEIIKAQAERGDTVDGTRDGV
jgi:hypothetical protein